MNKPVEPEAVQAPYRFWGRHPLWYKASCLLTFLGKESQLRKRAIERLHLGGGDVVLDLACGTGLNFPYLEGCVGRTGRIIGFDYSPQMLSTAREKAKRNNWQNIKLLRGDAAELSLECQVDGVLSTLGISAIPHHEQALERAVAVLKDNRNISLLDAALPSGVGGAFNPLLAWIYNRGACWDYTKDIPADLERILGRVERETYNGNTIYIVSGTKGGDRKRRLRSPLDPKGF